MNSNMDDYNTNSIGGDGDVGSVTYQPLKGSSTAIASSTMGLPKLDEEPSKELSIIESANSSADDDQSSAATTPKLPPPPLMSTDDDIHARNNTRNSTMAHLNNENDHENNNDNEKPIDRRNMFATKSHNPNNTDSQLSFGGIPEHWTVEQMNSNFAQRTWYREVRDSINNLRYRCGMIVNNKHVQTCIIIMIAINAIMMGLATFDFVKDNPTMSHRFEIVDQAFLILFTIELGLQFIYHGIRLLLDGWLVFDLIIITVSWSFAQVQIVRAFRIFRALRLVTRIKIMKNLLLALFGVMPRMAAIGLMLGLIFYIFGVMFTQLFKDLDNLSYDYFSSLGWTFFTLFQMMTLDDWASVCREVIEVYKWAWVPFILFVIISGFIVVNLIIAVICDAIGALHTDEKAKLHGDFEEDGSDAGESEMMDLRSQLDTLEDQMEDLTRIQARTFHTLQYLMRQVQMQKVKQELQSKADNDGDGFVEALKKLKSVRRESSTVVRTTGDGNSSTTASEAAAAAAAAAFPGDTFSSHDGNMMNINSHNNNIYRHQRPSLANQFAKSRRLIEGINNANSDNNNNYQSSKERSDSMEKDSNESTRTIDA